MADNAWPIAVATGGRGGPGCPVDLLADAKAQLFEEFADHPITDQTTTFSADRPDDRLLGKADGARDRGASVRRRAGPRRRDDRFPTTSPLDGIDEVLRVMLAGPWWDEPGRRRSTRSTHGCRRVRPSMRWVCSRARRNAVTIAADATASSAATVVGRPDGRVPLALGTGRRRPVVSSGDAQAGRRVAGQARGVHRVASSACIPATVGSSSPVRCCSCWSSWSSPRSPEMLTQVDMTPWQRGAGPRILDDPVLVRAVASGRQRGAPVRVPPGRAPLRRAEGGSAAAGHVVRRDPGAHPQRRRRGSRQPPWWTSCSAAGYANWHVESVDEIVQLRVTKKGRAAAPRLAAGTSGAGPAGSAARPGQAPPARAERPALRAAGRDHARRRGEADAHRQVPPGPGSAGGDRPARRRRGVARSGLGAGSRAARCGWSTSAAATPT